MTNYDYTLTLRLALLVADANGHLYRPEFIPALEAVRTVSRAMRETVDFEIDTVGNFDWYRMWRPSTLPANYIISPRSLDWRLAVVTCRLMQALTVTVEWNSGILEHFNMWRLVLDVDRGRAFGEYKVVSRIDRGGYVRCADVTMTTSNGHLSTLVEHLTSDELTRSSYGGVTRFAFYDTIEFDCGTLCSMLAILERSSRSANIYASPSIVMRRSWPPL